MRALIVGDTHGDLGSVDYALNVAVRNGIHDVVQVGDFGYGWEHTEKHPGRKPPFQRTVDRKAHEAGVDWYWLDGNHENFDQLEREVDVTADYPQLMWPEDGAGHLWYLPRGSTWTWGGLRFMALGGAYSIDKNHRVEGVSWWSQEMITRADVGRAMGAGSVDVMLTHDAPEGVCPVIDPTYKGDEFSAANRRALDAVIEVVQPRLLVHGHYHHAYRAQRGGLTVIGLDRDGSREKMVYMLDTEEV